MLIAFYRVQIENFRMTDSMNFGPDWIRNLPSEGSTGGGTAGGTKYQLAEFRYGREEMLALFDKSSKPPPSVTNFKYLYSETPLIPLALIPSSEEERSWQGRPNTLSGGPSRGRGGSLERGGRISRGRGYQYSRSTTYDGDQSDWSPRKEYNQRPVSMENWRRSRIGDQDEDGWRGVGMGRSTSHEKWGRSTSWRGEGDTDEKSGLPDRSSRSGWSDTSRAPQGRKSWDTDDHLPEWATENPTDGGGSFDDKGAFHGSDDEQLEVKPSNKREIGLQKSVSQQHISSKLHQHPLTSSKSTISLSKPEDSLKQDEVHDKEPEIIHKKDSESDVAIERNKSIPNIPEKIDKQENQKERAKSEGPPKFNEKPPSVANGPVPDSLKNEDSDFDRLQEDLVLKLMGDEETPKPVPNSFEVSGVPPPPNLIPQVPIQDRWFYQDPQGQMQGPFSNLEMAEWYKAGYFSNQLKVRRHCDERFFMLGELIAMCGGNPFQSSMRFPVLRNDVTKMPETDILQFQYLSQLAAYKQAQARIIQEPWSALTLQQQELAAQRLIMQQQQVSQDLQYIQQPPAANPLMHMISQMQQANKLPGQGLVDKTPQSIPSTLDAHLLHMGNLLSMQNRLPTNNITNNLPTGLPGNLNNPLSAESMSSSLPNVQTALPNLQNTLPNIPGGMPPVSIGSNINMSRPASHSAVEKISGSQNNDPISSLLKQLQQQQQQQPQQMDSLWQQNQFSIPTSATVTNHWQSQQNEIPSSMWDIQQNTSNNQPVVPVSTIESQITKTPDQEQKIPQPQVIQQKQKQEKEKEKPKDELSNSEKKKKKELEEKQAKKEAEEKRKQEQRKQDAEKRASEEKRKKEEERIKKEQEKARKEAEEKRLRELEEKRRLKEQRKNEEDSRKKQEEFRKLEEERVRQEIKDAEARRLAEEKRLQQEQLRIAKVAPWSHSNSTLGMSLAEIQKAEREKRAQDAAIEQQKLQEKEIQQQQIQQQQEKVAGIHLNWAKKPVEPRKVKSLAEIQAEEQEMLAKQAAETRLQKEKEKEILPVVNTSSSIWSSQNISWGNSSFPNSQWSSSTGGFWDDTSSRQPVQKPSSVTKSNSTNSVNVAAKQQQQLQQKQQLQQQQQSKTKTKKEETNKTNHNNNNNGPLDEFTNWCYKSLSNISSNVDIPTFITFLRELESAFDVREYCKEYLGESNATHQFATSFLEKRRSFRPKNNAHKDDMCSPAPAITPSLQHSTEFQEVKGKNKKNKKSKMLKVDARILGFNVTSAPDRINVGDRDYGDNS